MSNSENNKRIAKNTILLYFRMLLTMGVSLYTSRVVLNTLGVEDFGIYNVVGGVVMMFSFLNSSMSSATQRFLSFELGKQDYLQLKKVFSMSVNIHAIIAIVIFILAETVGLWFLNAKLVIPAERMNAANWVYQFSILSFMLTVMNVPYNATIIAHERMSVYAYVSIVEAILRLIIVLALVWLGFDKLKLYAVLVFGVSAIVWILYKIYCKRNFTEINYHFFWEKSLYKTLMNYAGWNLFGNIAGVTFNQGINIMLNIFFGPAINAARGIAYQINGTVNGFVSNFQMAVNPQIVKSYAADDLKYMHQLIFQGAKYSFFLLYILSLPILLETDIILKLWLEKVPEYTVIFTKLIFINLLIDSLSGTLIASAQASGRIKLYQSIVGGLLILNIPISYFLLMLEFQPQVTLYVAIIISIIALLFRLYILNLLINLSIKHFFKVVIFSALKISLFSLLLSYFIWTKMDYGFSRLYTTSLLSITLTILSIYYFGLNKNEKKYIDLKIFSTIVFIKQKLSNKYEKEHIKSDMGEK